MAATVDGRQKGHPGKKDGNQKHLSPKRNTFLFNSILFCCFAINSTEWRWQSINGEERERGKVSQPLLLCSEATDQVKMNFFLPPSFRDRETKKPSSSEKAFWSEPTSAAPPLSSSSSSPPPSATTHAVVAEAAASKQEEEEEENYHQLLIALARLLAAPHSGDRQRGFSEPSPFLPCFYFLHRSKKKRWRKSKSYFRFLVRSKIRKKKDWCRDWSMPQRGSGKKTRMSVQKYVGNDISEGGDEGLLLCLFGTPEG